MAIKWYSAFPKAPALPDCLVSHPGNTLMGSYPSAEEQLMYSKAPADWARYTRREKREKKSFCEINNWKIILSEEKVRKESQSVIL